jgi:hypothetical protein
MPPPKIAGSILEVIGNTPMVRINRITRGIIDATVLVKLETFNPGNSIKDRMAVKMIEDAERAGLLKPPAARSSRAPPATPGWGSPSRPSSRATGASSPRPTSSRRRRSTR